MTKYLINRILRSIVSIFIVVAVVMVMIYSALDRKLVFANDPVYNKQSSNGKVVYEMQKWEEYGYVDYVSYTEWLMTLLKAGEIDQATYDSVSKIPNKVASLFETDANGEYELDGEAADFMRRFWEEYEAKGYEIVPLDGDMKGKTKSYKDGGQPRLFAHKDVPLTTRLVKFFTGLISVDNIHYAENIEGERGLTFTLYDPAYGGEKFSPAIMGNGTYHRYLFYMDDTFPYIHQNLVKINLGLSYTINQGIDVFDTLTQAQGSYVYSSVTYPSGLVAESADNIHTAKYVSGSLANATPFDKTAFIDDYTSTTANKAGLSRMGYSFVIGIIATFLAYFLSIPLGTIMALKKDKLIDQIGNVYIIFITAVPSLAYIFMFKFIGGSLFGLPTTFDMENPTWKMYVLPIISLALPSVASLMKWLRRYMIDQMNSDYVKFARSGGLSETEIFSKHILKNAIIPIVHGIPGSILGAMTGAIITERVYVVPGAGNTLTRAINAYDNGVIVGMTLFYAVLTVVSIILGDVLMSAMDPRISFTSKER